MPTNISTIPTKKTVYKRHCLGCHRDFETTDRRKVYHNCKCQKAAFERRKHAEKLKPSEPKDCIGLKLDGTPCGLRFTPKRVTHKFHSDECQKRTRYLRDREKNVAAAIKRHQEREKTDPEYRKKRLAAQARYRREHRAELKATALSWYVRTNQKQKRKAHATELRALAAEAERVRAEAWRPPDWADQNKLLWRIIANELLLEEYLSNKQLAARLDSSKIIKCPYADTWLAAAVDKDNRGFKQLIWKVRKWIKKPGKVGKPKGA